MATFELGLIGNCRTSALVDRNAAILSSRFADDDGNGIEIVDFAPPFYLHGRMFSPLMLIRIIRRTASRPRIAIRVRPARAAVFSA